MVNVLKLDVEKALENVKMVSVVVNTDIVERHQNSVPFLMVVKKNTVVVKKKKSSYGNHFFIYHSNKNNKKLNWK